MILHAYTYIISEISNEDTRTRAATFYSIYPPHVTAFRNGLCLLQFHKTADNRNGTTQALQTDDLVPYIKCLPINRSCSLIMN